MSAEQIFKYHSFEANASLNATDVRDISATVLYRASKAQCSGSEDEGNVKPTRAECEYRAYLDDPCTA